MRCAPRRRGRRARVPARTHERERVSEPLNAWAAPARSTHCRRSKRASGPRGRPSGRRGGR
eukprot:9332-Pleurochrysis_carterae.AAC.1